MHEKESSHIEYQFQKLFELSHDLLSIASFDGYLLEVNQKWVETLGYSREELTSQPYINFIHPDDLNRTSEETQRIAIERTSVDKFQNRYKCKNGEYVWLEWVGAIDEKNRKIYSVARNITEDKKKAKKNTEFQDIILFLSDLSTIEISSQNGFIKYFLIALKNYYEVECVSYWDMHEGDKVLECTHEVFSKEQKTRKGLKILKADFPEYFTHVLSEKIISAHQTNLHPATSKLHPYYLQDHKIKSKLDCQIVRGDNLNGVISIESCSLRKWTADEEVQLMAISNILSNAFANGHMMATKKRFESLYNNSTVMMHSINTQGELINVNNKWLETLGYSREEVIGKKSYDFFTKKSKDYAINTALPLFFKQGHIKDIEYEFIAKDGRIVTTLLSASAEKDNNGEITHSIAILEDISEKKASEERFKIISDIATDFAFAIEVLPDGSKSVKWLFGAFEQITGYTRDYFKTHYPFSNIIHEEDRLRIEKQRKAFETSGQGEVFEYRIKHKKGYYIWIEEKCLALFSTADKQLSSLFGSVRNITNQKLHLKDLTEAKEELMKAYRLLKGSNEAAKIGHWEVGLTNMSLYWSGMTRKIHEVPVGFQPNVETAINFYKEGYSRDLISKVFEEAIAEGTSYDIEVEIVTYKNNLKWVRSIGIPITENGKVVNIYGLFQDIDERKRAEIENKRLSLVASQVQNCVIITSANQKIQWVNESFTRLTGYELEEVIGKKPGELLQGENTSPEHVQAIKDGIKSKKPFTQEIINYTKTGEEYWIELSITPIFNDQNQLFQFIGIQQIITERKQAEKAIKEHKELLSRITNNVPGALFKLEINLKTEEMQLLFLSEQSESLTEIPNHEALNDLSKYSELIEPEDIHGLREAILFSIENNTFFNHNWRLNTPSGKQKWLNGRGTPDTRQNNIINLDVIVLDISEQIKTEKKLADKSRRLSSVIEATNVGTWEWNVQTGHLTINKRWANILGYELEELEPISIETWLKNVHPEDLERSNRLLDQHFNGETEFYEMECRMLSKSGETIWIWDKGKIISWTPEGKPLMMFGTHTDITSQMKAEKEIQRMQKLDELGTIAGGIAHDFNNILTGVQSNIEWIKMDIDSTHRYYQSMEETQRALQEAKYLTGQLLTFSKGGSPIIETVETQKLVKDTVNFNLRGSKVQALFNFEKNLWPILADKGQIVQVIANLTINAMHAMPRGGKLYISAGNLESRNDKEPKMIKLSFQDEGCGIASENLEKIFNPYFTTKEGGHGLGLSVAHSIINQHKGTIDVESNNKGTTFFITLPAAQIEMNQRPIEVECNKKNETESLNILLMEDNAMIRKAMNRTLSILGHSVETAKDGDEAIDSYIKAQKLKPFDLIIMDLTIPGGKGGQETIKEILEIDPKAKVIASSGYTSDSAMANFENYGFAESLPKPYTVDELTQKIQIVMSQ
ncbi:PAS domain-containing protein [Reichenbachiella ulvae]|uniref:histidine kinase n=1 Tax=Reichenbachiella ulvae TaxID=2980104 RepID=A0ABT3CNU7_9BACT|nr:PAS domain-containing protein [Reichenbachiella ulvae]MCV9385390.1 PAS domain-containing protein [Reichenbachiella ulvae]